MSRPWTYPGTYPKLNTELGGPLRKRQVRMATRKHNAISMVHVFREQLTECSQDKIDQTHALFRTRIEDAAEGLSRRRREVSTFHALEMIKHSFGLTRENLHEDPDFEHIQSILKIGGINNLPWELADCSPEDPDDDTASSAPSLSSSDYHSGSDEPDTPLVCCEHRLHMALSDENHSGSEEGDPTMT